MMVKVYKQNPKTRRKLHLSRAKLLCAAGLTLCDFTNTDAAKAEGYFPDQTHRSSHGLSPEIFVPSIEESKIIKDADLDQATKSVNRPSIPLDVQRGTVTHSRAREDSFPAKASEKQPPTQNRSDYLSIASNGSTNGLPHPPPPQWIRDNRYDQPQSNNLPATFNNYPNTKNDSREFSLNTHRDERSASPNFATNVRARQRRVPLHLQQTTAQQQQNFHHTHQQTGVPSKSNQSPLAPTQLHDGYGPNDYPNNRHARSYQSRMMHSNPEHQKSISELNSNDLSRTAFKEPLTRDRWSQKVHDDQQYNQFTVNQGRAGFRSLREPTISQYTRGTGIPMSNKSKKVLDINHRPEMGRVIDDPNNAIVSFVPGPSNSQLAIVPPSFHDAISEAGINQVGTNFNVSLFENSPLTDAIPCNCTAGTITCGSRGVVIIRFHSKNQLVFIGHQLTLVCSCVTEYTTSYGIQSAILRKFPTSMLVNNCSGIIYAVCFRSSRE
jgi:hypothetical protein